MMCFESRLVEKDFLPYHYILSDLYLKFVSFAF